MKYRILFVTGSRSEYGLFRSTIMELQKSSLLSVDLLVTGMHTLRKYGLSLDSIKKDGLVGCVVPIKEADDMVTALNREIEGIYKYVRKNTFSAILVVGDRGESFAAATVGAHLNVPVIHISGGDVSGPTVDHLLRNAISMFSKLHLVQTEQSKMNVIKLGADKKNVLVVGSAGLDKLKKNKLLSREKLADKFGINAKRKWFLISMHPTPFEITSFANQINPLIGAVKKLDRDDEKIIIYPNSDTGSDVFINTITSLPLIDSSFHVFKNIDRKDYLGLLNNSVALIGNSSSGLMEAGFLKIPFINVGNRQKGRESGPNVISVGYNELQILHGVAISQSAEFKKRLNRIQSVYNGGNVSAKITRKIESFLKKYYA